MYKRQADDVCDAPPANYNRGRRVSYGGVGRVGGRPRRSMFVDLILFDDHMNQVAHTVKLLSLLHKLSQAYSAVVRATSS